MYIFYLGGSRADKKGSRARKGHLYAYRSVQKAIALYVCERAIQKSRWALCCASGVFFLPLSLFLNSLVALLILERKTHSRLRRNRCCLQEALRALGLINRNRISRLYFFCIFLSIFIIWSSFTDSGYTGWKSISHSCKDFFFYC